MSTELKLVQVQPPVGGTLQELRASALTLFEGGPVIILEQGSDLEFVAATITEAVRHTVLNWFGDGRELTELHDELVKLNPRVSFTEHQAWGLFYLRRFHHRLSEQYLWTLSQATARVIAQLEGNPELASESDRRYAYRDNPAELYPRVSSSGRRRRYRGQHPRG